MRVRLAAIPSAEEAVRNLETFAFVASHLFSTVRQHSSAVVELLRLIERLKELHTKAQEMISSHHPATTLLYDMSRQWSLYLNRFVAASSSESLEALGSNVPFSLDPIMVDLEGGRNVFPIQLVSVADLVAGGRTSRRSGGSGGVGGYQGGCGVATAKKRKASSTGETRGCGCVTMHTCPPCHFRTGITCVPSWWGWSSRPCPFTFFIRTGPGAGCDGRNASVQNRTFLIPPEVATNVAGMLKAAQGDCHEHL